MDRIPRWGTFEASIENPKDYTDPFRSVELKLDFHAPDGRRIRFWGFYDGNRIWRFRCMPDQLGVWVFNAEFSDGSVATSGSFECVESDIPGLIHKDEENPFWFGYKGGRHVQIRSFHVGDKFFAANFPDAERDGFLDWLQAQKYNTLSIASHLGNRQSRGRGLGWETPSLWHHGEPDPNAYATMERILDVLARRRILVYQFAGFFGRAASWPAETRDQILYIKYTIARIGAYWNILFNVAGPEPILPVNPFMLKSEVDRLGYLIRKFDVFDHLLSVHNATGRNRYEYEDYLNYITLQGPKTIDRRQLAKELAQSHQMDKPLYAQETLWPGNSVGHPPYSLEDIRKNAIVLIMSGAAINFGDFNGESSSGFSGTLDQKDCRPERHGAIRAVWDFFEDVPFYRMLPDTTATDTGYCLAEKNVRYLCYLESGGPVRISIPAGSWYGTWIKAADPSIRKTTTITPGASIVAPNDCDDWFLDIEKRD